MLKHELRGHKGGVLCTAISNDGRHIATGGTDQTVQIWCSEAGQDLCTLCDHKAGVQTVVFNKDDSLLASGDQAGIILIWQLHRGCDDDYQDPTVLCTLDSSPYVGNVSSVLFVQFSPDSLMLASCNYGEYPVLTWCVRLGKKLLELTGSDSFGGGEPCAAWSSDSKQLDDVAHSCVGYGDGRVLDAIGP
jgi:WD40 repeat protein